LKTRSRVWKNVRGVGIKQRGVTGLGIDAKEGERSQIILNKSFVEFLEEGGVTPLGGGRKKVKMKEWRGINERKGVGSVDRLFS
jgi:hypothetical protein